MLMIRFKVLTQMDSIIELRLSNIRVACNQGDRSEMMATAMIRVPKTPREHWTNMKDGMHANGEQAYPCGEQCEIHTLHLTSV